MQTHSLTFAEPFFSTLQNLKLEMDDKDSEVTQLNEDANEMLSKAPSGSLQDLARSLMRMNALWTYTYQQVEHYSKLYLTSDQRWREFKGTLLPCPLKLDAECICSVG